MIERYNTPEISKIWSLEAKYNYFLQAELAILKTFEGNEIPNGTSEKIREIAKININRILEIEKTTKHDVIAFCSSVTEQLSPEISKFFHFGVTSSDIIDTAFTLQIKESLDIILPTFKNLIETLKKSALSYKHLISMGRSHGMFAEPMSFGQKFLSSYSEFKRRYNDLESFYNEELTGQFSGAVGNYTILSPTQENEANKSLNLKAEPISTQVIPRDRVAKLISINSLTACAIERLCVELRHLHHSDINELHEGFSKGQKGSSIMPHKKNPIAGENLTGISRVLKSHLSIALENTVLWHERDISHSSAERIYIPDNLGLLQYALKRLTSTLENLVVHEDIVSKKVQNNITYLSSYYLHFLILNTDYTREELYPLLQETSFSLKDSNEPKDFYLKLLETAQSLNLNLPNSLPEISTNQLEGIYLKHVDEVFNRVLQ